MVVEIKTPPTTEPITLSAAKEHVIVTHYEDDVFIQSLIRGARAYVEKYTNRYLVTQTVTYYLDKFPRKIITVPFGPVQDVESITYIDTDGDEQSFTDYRADTKSTYARISPNYDESWPSTLDVTNAVEIEMVVGYGSDVPDDLVGAMKLLIGGWYENRDGVSDRSMSEIPFGVNEILDMYRMLDYV